MCGNHDNMNDSNDSSGDRNHTNDSRGVNASDDCKFGYGPGGNNLNINTEDSSMRDVSDSSSSGNVSRATDTSPTHAHCTDTLALSFEVTDDDKDFAQRACPCCDSHPSAQYRTGEFVSADMPRVMAVPYHIQPY